MVGKRIGALLKQGFFERDSLVVAEELIGAFFVSRLGESRVVLRVTETEAYRVGDSASHCRSGRTPRNAPMWGPPGRAYVYVCYGIHAMLNVVAERDGVGAGVLIRSGEVVDGVECAVERRSQRGGPSLAAGPGNVAKALGVTRADSGRSLIERGLLELRSGAQPDCIASGKRIGIDYATEQDRAASYRFADGNSAAVTHRRQLSNAPRQETTR